MQFRMSPGGSILKSSRNRPDEPPSSVTVTTAESSRIMHRKEGQGGGGGPWCSGAPIRIPRRRSGVATYRFSPRNSVDNPGPPPMATTRSSLSFGSIKLDNGMREVSYPSLNAIGSVWITERLEQFPVGVPGCLKCMAVLLSRKTELHRIIHFAVTGEFALNLRIEQLREAWIVSHILKVRVGTRLDSIAWILPDRLRQVLETLMRVACHAGQDRQPVQSILGLIVRLQNELELLPRILIMPIVQQRDGIVVVLLVTGKRVLSLRRLQQTRVAVHSCAFRQLSRASCQHLFERRMRLIVFPVLHQPQR